jgi:hypothetical protein
MSEYKNRPAYMDAHCAGWLGQPCPQHTDQVKQQAADRGYWDGSKKREQALARTNDREPVSQCN